MPASQENGPSQAIGPLLLKATLFPTLSSTLNLFFF